MLARSTSGSLLMSEPSWPGRLRSSVDRFNGPRLHAACHVAGVIADALTRLTASAEGTSRYATATHQDHVGLVVIYSE